MYKELLNYPTLPSALDVVPEDPAVNGIIVQTSKEKLRQPEGSQELHGLEVDYLVQEKSWRRCTGK